MTISDEDRELAEKFFSKFTVLRVDPATAFSDSATLLHVDDNGNETIRAVYVDKRFTKGVALAAQDKK